MSEDVERSDREIREGDRVSAELKSQVAQARAWLETERPRYVRIVDPAQADLDAWEGCDEGEPVAWSQTASSRGGADA